MPEPHDIKQVLRAAAAPRTADAPADPPADLARARAAMRVRTRRRLRLALSGVTTATVLSVGVVAVLDTGPDERDATTLAPEGPHERALVRLVAQRFTATPYTFDLTPRGWSVQGRSPFGVVIAPDDGGVSAHPDDFAGKLVILFDTNPTTGRVLEQGGRTFWVTGDSGYTTLSTLTRDDEPPGVVRIQYPDDAGWDEATMVDFLGSVHVGPGAQPGLG